MWSKLIWRSDKVHKQGNINLVVARIEMGVGGGSQGDLTKRKYVWNRRR